MEVRDVLVTGGTGRLGRRVVDLLRAEGIEPRAMSRSGRPGTIKGDLLTGEGIEAAVRGADTIIHAAQSPNRKSRRTAVGGTERLLELATGAGVSHFVYISVVGLERVSLSYYREKLDAERLVERSPVPWTILRSTQFQEFLKRQGGLTQDPKAPTREGMTGMLNGLFYSGPSIETLHEEYAKKGRIDEEAPVKASREVHIEAPVERVWGLLSDPRGWGTWYPDIHDVRLNPRVEADARFDWANGKAHMRSRFAVVEAEREITWTGVAYGAKAVHRHVLEPTDGGATRVFSEESMAGPLLVLFYNSAKLGAEMEEWLSALNSVTEAFAEER